MNLEAVKFEEAQEIDATRLFSVLGIFPSETKILQNSRMYPYKEELEDNWSYHTISAVKKISKRQFSSVAVVGAGNGIEAIAAQRLLTPKNLYLSDIEEQIVSGASENVIQNIRNSRVNLRTFTGSMFEPYIANQISVDLVLANLPNLFTPKASKSFTASERGSLVEKGSVQGECPEKFKHWALCVQYRFLSQVSAALNPDTTVLLALGDRPPEAIVNDLFRETGFIARPLVRAVKRQTEAEIDLASYANLERRHGVNFKFSCLEDPALRFSATEARVEFEKGRKISHAFSVYCLSGVGNR